MLLNLISSSLLTFSKLAMASNSKTKSYNTRSRSNHYIFGEPIEKLCSYMLPSWGDLMKRYLYDLENDPQLMDKQRLSDSDKLPVFKKIGQEVSTLWDQSGIPYIEEKSIYNKLKEFLNKYHRKASTNKTKREEDTSQNRIWKDNFLREMNFYNCFDIAICRCFKDAKDIQLVLYGGGDHKPNCYAPIPPDELNFYASQLFERGEDHCLTIGRMDLKTRKLMIQNEEKVKKQTETQEKLKQQQNADFSTVNIDDYFSDDDDYSDEPSETDSEGDDKPKTAGDGIPPRRRQVGRCSVQYKRVASGSLRYGTSARSTRAIINWVIGDLMEFGAIKEEFTEGELMIGLNNVIDQRNKYAGYLADEHAEVLTDLVCLKFDGKKCDTLIEKNRTVKQEHITCIAEPGSFYVDHFTPATGTGADISNELFDMVLEYDSKDTLLCVGADGILVNLANNVSSHLMINFQGTGANTGHNKGAIMNLENKLCKPLQWCICLLHFNELPMRHFIEHIDGDFTGPESAKGPVGKIVFGKPKLWMKNPHNFRKFKDITKSAKEMFESMGDPKDLLNDDQYFFYQLCMAVLDGNSARKIWPDGFWNKPPAKIHLARWITAATAILRLFCQTKANADIYQNLFYLVKFILNVYAPMYFSIKTNWHFIEGPRLFFKASQLVLEAFGSEPEHYDHIIKYFDINSYFAHPENVLVSAVFDPDKTIQEQALLEIDALRKYWKKYPNKVRHFELHVDRMDLKAKNYYEMIKWEKYPKRFIADPPFLKQYSMAQLRAHVDGTEIITLPAVPNHSQAVERNVQNVTFAASKVVGHEKRHEFLLNLEENRKNYPTYANKSFFFLDGEKKFFTKIQ